VDVILLAAGLYSVKKLLCTYEAFAKEYDVIHRRVNFMDGHIVQSLNEKHLGNIIGRSQI